MQLRDSEAFPPDGSAEYSSAPGTPEDACLLGLPERDQRKVGPSGNGRERGTAGVGDIDPTAWAWVEMRPISRLRQEGVGARRRARASA